jgi:hypothetical protein
MAVSVRRPLLLLVLCAGCQNLRPYDGPDGGAGGGSSSPGGGAGGGATGGGSACAPSCTSGCGFDGCGHLCRTAAAPSCDGGVCVLPAPIFGDAPFTHLWGTRSGELWVVRSSGYAYHWNDAGWACLETGLASNNDVWADTNEVWVVGARADGGAPALRFAWGTGAVTQVLSPVSPLQSVWGSGGEAYVGSASGSIFRGTGTSLSLDNDGGEAAVDLQGLSTGNVWAASGGTAVSQRSHLTGTWSDEKPGITGLVAVYPEDDGSTVHALTQGGGLTLRRTGWMPDESLGLVAIGRALSGSGKEVYAVGEVGGRGALFRRDPTLRWQRVLDDERSFYDVSAVADGTVWVAADQGTVLQYRPAACDFATVPIADAFDAPLSTHWTVEGAWMTVQGQLQGTAASAPASHGEVYAHLDRPGFSEASLSLEIVEPARIAGSDADVSTFLYLFHSGSSNEVKLELKNGALLSYLGSQTIPVSIAQQPDGGAHFVRIREAAGSVYFEISNNPKSGWKPFDQQVEDGGQSWLADVDVVGIGVYNGSSGGTVSPATFDNLNRCP